LPSKPERRVEEFAVDIELRLIPRSVSDPHGAAPPPPGQLREEPFGQVMFAADAEHDLQMTLGARVRGGRRHEVEEFVGFVRAGRNPEGFHGETGVAYPGVAVVPVAFTADFLGQGGCGGGHDRTGGLVAQRL